MPKKKKGIEPSKTIVELLESIKMPLFDKVHNLFYILDLKQEATKQALNMRRKHIMGCNLLMSK